jgi:hypothetical protein
MKSNGVTEVSIITRDLQRIKPNAQLLQGPPPNPVPFRLWWVGWPCIADVAWGLPVKLASQRNLPLHLSCAP